VNAIPRRAIAEPASGAAAVECAENENKSLDAAPALSTLKFYAPAVGSNPLPDIIPFPVIWGEVEELGVVSARPTKEYFAKLPDGRYARFSIKFYAGNRNFIVFESYLNPKSGSRNLEFDPQKTVKVR
jgi:hypothetical protein